MVLPSLGAASTLVGQQGSRNRRFQAAISTQDQCYTERRAAKKACLLASVFTPLALSGLRTQVVIIQIIHGGKDFCARAKGRKLVLPASDRVHRRRRGRHRCGSRGDRGRQRRLGHDRGRGSSGRRRRRRRDRFRSRRLGFRRHCVGTRNIIATLIGPRHRRHSGSRFWRTRPHVADVTIVTPSLEEYCLHSRPGGGALGGGVFGAFGST